MTFQEWINTAQGLEAQFVGWERDLLNGLQMAWEAGYQTGREESVSDASLRATPK